MREKAKFGGFLMYFLSFLTGFFNTSMVNFSTKIRWRRKFKKVDFLLYFLSRF